MKYFLIKYRFEHGSQAEWHQEMARFIAALENDPELRGKISYRCMKAQDGADYYHIASAADDQAPKTLGSRDFFTHYTERCEAAAAGGNVEVLPLEIVAETNYKA